MRIHRSTTSVETPFPYLRRFGQGVNGGRASVRFAHLRARPATDTWTATTTTGAPTAREFHTAVWTGSRMVVWGGSGRIAHLNTGGAYVPIDSSDDDGDGYSEADGDGPSACAGDCNDADPTVWVVPGETRGLEFSSDKTILTWSAPLFPGGSLAIYDTLRSPSRSDFLDAGMCLETGGDDTQTPDAETPSQGSGFYYLVRATNACGIGTLGQRSNQDERYGRSCA